MAKQSASDSLKESIRLLEIRQEEEGRELKEQFRATYESLKPINLLKISLKELAGSAEIKNTLFETVVSILTGYLTKKMMVGSKSNPLLKILGALLQFGVTSLVAKNAESIRNFISDLIDRLFHPEAEEVPETK
ncbi:MAG: hypothetical protein Q8S54_07920 [Bacteroidota bacterium]|nr:hypothetical protein [Odoribacter sp.]MDP3643102.1 hypothetical protein [Bacteroidota bacterium]